MMRPAFSSTWHAASFTLLLLALLLSPVLVGKKILPPRRQLYDSLQRGNTPIPWMRNQIFEEKSDVDIALVGSSHINSDINTSYLQEKLSERLGRPAVVRTIGWGGKNYEMLYFITRDLLEHRKVRMLVFYDENSTKPNLWLQTWFRFGEDAALLSGLPCSDKALLYFAAIMGMPRNLLCLLRSNLPVPTIARDNYWESRLSAPDPATRFGAVRRDVGFTPRYPLPPEDFVPFAPNTAARPEDALVYSPATQSEFEFSRIPLPAGQAIFAGHFAALLNEHRVKPVMVYLPVLAEARLPSVPESAFWPEIFGADLTLVGIPPLKLFGDMKKEDLRKIFSDPGHFNRNGQDYFTPLVTPSLVKIYEDSTHR
jgi:hypothetical protein